MTFFRIFTMLKCRIWPFPHKKTPFYSFHTFACIKQHYFAKYWGDGCMGRPPPQIWGAVPPRYPPLCILQEDETSSRVFQRVYKDGEWHIRSELFRNNNSRPTFPGFPSNPEDKARPSSSDRIVKMEGGVEIFLQVGGREKSLGSKLFFNTGLKKRWGLNFVIKYRRKR